MRGSGQCDGQTLHQRLHDCGRTNGRDDGTKHSQASDSEGGTVSPSIQGQHNGIDIGCGKHIAAMYSNNAGGSLTTQGGNDKRSRTIIQKLRVQFT